MSFNGGRNGSGVFYEIITIGIHPTKVWLSQLVNFKNAIKTWGQCRRMIWSLWGVMKGVAGIRKSEHQSQLAKELGLLCWCFKGVQEEIPSEEASNLQMRSVAFPAGQCTSPQLHPSTKMGIKTVPRPSYIPDLAPCDFLLFPNFRGCRYETIEELKEVVTKAIDTL